MSSAQNNDNSLGPEGQETRAQTESMSIKVTDNDNELVFKIKKSTRMEKLMTAFCERHGKALNSVRFIFEGKRVLTSHTPQSLEIEDGDTIEVYYEQIGGNGFCPGAPAPRLRAGDEATHGSLWNRHN